MFDYASYLVVLAFGLIIANGIANKKISIVGLVLALLGVAIYLTKHIEALNNVYLAIDSSEHYVYFLAVAIMATLASLASLIYSSLKHKNINKLFEVAATFDDEKVLAIASKKGKLLKCSSKLENIIDKFDYEANEYDLSITRFRIDGHEYDNKLLLNLKNVLKTIVLNQEDAQLSFVYSNGLTMDLNVGIEEVSVNKKLYGYALFDKNIIATDDYKVNIDKASKKTTFMYLDMLDSDVAYYDNVVNKYILTNHFFNSLGLNKDGGVLNSITKDEFTHFIHKDDIVIYKGANVVPSKVLKIYYRIKLTTDYEWFEESIFVDKGKEYRILRRVDAVVANKVQFGNYKGLINNVDELSKKKASFGIIMLNLYSLPKINANIGTEMTNLVVSSFFTKTINGILKGATKAYKISSIEYALVVNDAQLLNVIKRDLTENHSYLTKQEIIINNIKETIDAEVGIVDTSELESFDCQGIIRVAFDMLKQASDPAYPKNYSIYTKTTPVNLDYSLAELGIDLDEDLSVYDEDSE